MALLHNPSKFAPFSPILYATSQSLDKPHPVLILNQTVAEYFRMVGAARNASNLLADRLFPLPWGFYFAPFLIMATECVTFMRHISPLTRHLTLVSFK